MNGFGKIDCHIRWMIRRDMPEVLATETQSFPSPWSEDDFIRCLRQRNCIGMVAEHDEKIIGFMLYELHKARLHVLNLAVHPEFRRRGVGVRFIDKLKGKLSIDTGRRQRLVLPVADYNLPAQLFCRACRLRATHISEQYFSTTGDYLDRDIDAYIFEFCATKEEPCRL